MKYILGTTILMLVSSTKLNAQDKYFFTGDAIFKYGGIERLDTSSKYLFLTFTGGDFGEGTMQVRKILKQQDVPASFFFTGDFYRNPANSKAIRKLIRDGHYLGAHSDKHLLYASWEDRDSLLVSEMEFKADLLENYSTMEEYGLRMENSRYFMPPYEWYNDSISVWTSELGQQLINYTPGTRSNADYTTPDMGSRYIDSGTIMKSIFDYERKDPHGLNGFILLLHVGTDPLRTDKFYDHLDELIERLRKSGYRFSSFKNVFF